jgi:hypothetical protein|tara:strand:+ start:2822 stop:3292 length:471 start_codon:yes stop_codon:yes gene_type:complete
MTDGKATERKPRETETRAASERERAWEPPQVLPDPKPQDGYCFRWIRTAIMGSSDNVNTSKRFREGWEPVRAEDHPELMLVSDKDSTFKGNIEVGGLLLCKTSAENIVARNKYYNEMAKRQMDSVDQNYMRESDPRMPKLNESSTRISFGGGVKPE